MHNSADDNGVDAALTAMYSPKRRLWRWAVVILILVIGVICGIGLGQIGTRLRQDTEDGAPESDYLSADEINTCVSKHPRTFSELKNCLYQHAYRPRLEKYFSNPHARDREWIRALEPHERAAFVPNPSIQPEDAALENAEYMVYKGNEVPGAFGSGGPTDIWQFYVGKNDVLLGWVPPPDYRK